MGRTWIRIYYCKVAIRSLYRDPPKMRHYSRIINWALIVVFTGFSVTVAADEWELKGLLGQQLQYNDNINFSTILPQSVFGYLLMPLLEASRKTGAFDIAFKGQGDIRRYDDSRWDCDNYNLGMNNAYRTNRSVFGLGGGYTASCTYAQQIADTGILVPNSQVQNFRVAPSWIWQWTQLTQLLAEASYSKTSFSNLGIVNDGTTGFSGNDMYSLKLGGNHIWSPRLSLNGGLLFSNIQYTEANISQQNLYGFLLGANYLMTRQWQASMGVGLRLIDDQQQSNLTLGPQNTALSLGPVANIKVSYNGQRNRFSTGYSTDPTPSAIGQTLQTHALFANYSYSVTQQVFLDIATSLNRSEAVTGQSTGTTTGSFNRDFIFASAGLAWQIAKDWQLKGSYRYQWQHFPQQGDLPSLLTGTAESNSVMLFLNYAWDGIRDSR